MKLPLSWIKEFIPLYQSDEEIAAILTMAGIEVDEIQRITLSLQGTLVAKVIETRPHPNANRLSLATVTDGTSVYEVVCGAPNCRAGLVTAFAREGTCGIDNEGRPWKIEKAIVRGIESCGMLCSEAELGLSKEQSGIIELPVETKLGIPLEELFEDSIFTISLTPNLIHCASIYGIARELSALTGIPLILPAISSHEGEKPNPLSVHIENTPRYAIRVVHDVRVGPSPTWIKRRLEACGQRSVNNVVDITNYLLLEYGQPLHAFDLDKIAGHKIYVRQMTDAISFETLDHVHREIPPGTLVICDEKKVLALAGIMGGKDSEVGPHTTAVAIESATFDPILVRRASKALNLSTEASKHFERGSDICQVIPSLERAASLIQQVCGGEIAHQLIDCLPRSYHPRTLTCRISQVNRLLGTSLSRGEVEQIFKRLEAHITHEGSDTLHVQIPSYRGDLTSEIDLVEEVARLYGYNNLPKRAPKHITSNLPHSSDYLLEKNIREKLVALGLQEFMTCNLISPKGASILKSNEIAVLKPSSIEQSILRSSLLPGLLDVVKHNLDVGEENLFGFEVGRVHFKEEDRIIEETRVAIILCGRSKPYHFESKKEEGDFFDLKGIIENLYSVLNLKPPLFVHSQSYLMHPGIQASFEAGVLGQLLPSLCRKWSIEKPIFFAELSLPSLAALPKRQNAVTPLPQFPSVTRDWTVKLKEEFPIQTVIDFISTIASPILFEVFLLDQYLPTPGEKNATYRFIFRALDRTLSLKEVEKEQARIVQATEELLASSGGVI